MMSQSDFLKNAGRWGGSDVAARHYRAAVLSNVPYANLTGHLPDLLLQNLIESARRPTEFAPAQHEAQFPAEHRT